MNRVRHKSSRLVGLLACSLVLGWVSARAAGGSPPDACRAVWQTLDSGDAEVAAERFAALTKAPGLDGCAVEGRIVALIRLDRWKQALEEAREYHGLPGGDGPRVVTGLGEALWRAGELEEAEGLLAPLVREGRAPGRALGLMGTVKVAAGHVAEAIELMNRAVEAAPDDRTVLFRAAEAAPSRTEAIRRLERYLELSEGDDPDRIVAARGTLRTLRALGEREIWIVDSPPARVELPLSLFGLDGGRLGGAVATARVGKKRKILRLLIDSGSPGLFLVERLARRGGFEELSVETAFGGGGEGRHRSPRGLLPSLSLGELTFRDALGTTTEVEFEPTGRYHGVLGLSAFDGYRVTLDLSKGRVLLERSETELEGARYWTVAGQMLVRASLEGGPSGLFLFDTGATTSVLDIDFARSAPNVHVHQTTGLRGYGGKIAHAWVVDGGPIRFQGLDSGDGTLRATDLSQRSRLGGVELAGFLGLDLLGGKRLIVDTVARRLKVEAAD